MLDHLALNVSDYERSRDFYAQALAPLGLSLLMEPRPRDRAASASAASREFWITDRASRRRENVSRRVRGPRSRDGRRVPCARRSPAGGTDNGPPGVREIYHPTYYGAFVLDPDGNNIEAVCHRP